MNFSRSEYCSGGAFPFSRGSSQPRNRIGLLHCRWILFQPSPKGSPRILRCPMVNWQPSSLEEKSRGASVSFWDNSSSTLSWSSSPEMMGKEGGKGKPWGSLFCLFFFLRYFWCGPFFKRLDWICYNIASVLCFGGFLAPRLVGS